MTALNGLAKKALTAVQGTLRALTFPLRRDEYRHKTIVACVFSTGERSESLCIESVRRQRLPVKRIEVIRNVTPMHAAFNRMFEVAGDADYILCVDADMVLYHGCLARLLGLARPDTLYCLGTLIDPVLGKVGYIKLLNMDIVRRLGIRFRDVHGCDVDFTRQAQEAAPSIRIESYTVLRRPLGIHRPTYTARELFRKNQIEKKKRGNRNHERLLRSMRKRYYETGNRVLLAGILGETMPNPDTSTGEVDPSGGMDNWPEVERLIGPVPDGLEFGFDEEYIRKKVF